MLLWLMNMGFAGGQQAVTRAPVICPASDVLNLAAARADVYTGLPVAADVLSREAAEGDIA